MGCTAARRRGYSRTTTPSMDRWRPWAQPSIVAGGSTIRPSPNCMSIFDKCSAYTLAREVQALGVYPYFWPIEESTATEARICGQWKIMVGSNNYLGLTHHPHVLDAARSAMLKYGSGSTGSRFLNGTLDLHYTLEARLARFLGKQSALV